MRHRIQRVAQTLGLTPELAWLVALVVGLGMGRAARRRRTTASDLAGA